MICPPELGASKVTESRVMGIFDMNKNLQILIPRFRCLAEEMNSRNHFYGLTYKDRQELRLARLNEAWRDARRYSGYYSELSRRLSLPDRFALSTSSRHPSRAQRKTLSSSTRKP